MANCSNRKQDWHIGDLLYRVRGRRSAAVVRFSKANFAGRRIRQFNLAQEFGTGTACFQAGRSLANGLAPLKIIIDGALLRPTPKLSTVSSTSQECASETRG